MRLIRPPRTRPCGCWVRTCSNCTSSTSPSHTSRGPAGRSCGRAAAAAGCCRRGRRRCRWRVWCWRGRPTRPAYRACAACHARCAGPLRRTAPPWSFTCGGGVVAAGGGRGGGALALPLSAALPCPCLALPCPTTLRRMAARVSITHCAPPFRAVSCAYLHHARTGIGCGRHWRHAAPGAAGGSGAGAAGAGAPSPPGGPALPGPAGGCGGEGGLGGPRVQLAGGRGECRAGGAAERCRGGQVVEPHAGRPHGDGVRRGRLGAFGLDAPGRPGRDRPGRVLAVRLAFGHCLRDEVQELQGWLCGEGGRQKGRGGSGGGSGAPPDQT